MRKMLHGGVACAALLFGATAYADSISPNSVTATIAEGGSITIHKTVTVDAGTPTTSKVDVYFMADTTGSMGGAITAVRNSAAAILAGAAGLGDVAFAVGEYKDFGDSYAYRLNQTMTASQPATTAGINLWSASGGGDYAEADLYALSRAATDAATGWRAGSERIIVWFGDAPSHDPSGGATLASTIGALNGQNIAVEAVNVGTVNGFAGFGVGLDDLGQATAIANGTGGHLYNGINSGSIVATIQAAITTAIATYTSVGIDLSGVPSGLTATVVPGSYTGAFDRSVARTFEFDVTLTGDTAGVYGFNVYGTVDGGRVATETDSITVLAASGPSVPDMGSTLLLLGCAVTGLQAIRRKIS